MNKRGFQTKRRRLTGDKQIKGAVETWHILDMIHPPTAASFVIGAAGGAYLSWKLFEGKGAVAVVLAIIAGIIIGMVVGVIGYWLFRLFSALG